MPRDHAARPYPLRMLVAVHDTLRNNQALRDQFAEYAERNNALVLAPLFPAEAGSPPELDQYKYLRHGQVRFDEIVLRMAEEVARLYPVDASRFDLFGFSGGGHFAHRFLYAQPARIARLVAAAPGSVTLPVHEYGWWPGLKDFETVFGRPVPWNEIERVPVHLVVGARDTQTSGTIQSRDHPRWAEGADAAGGNRVERLTSLYEHLKRRGAQASFEQLEGVAHEAEPIVRAAIRFFEARAT